MKKSFWKIRITYLPGTDHREKNTGIEKDRDACK
jgi:hypothetical protein